jgi:virginiamycin B lyase
LALDPSTRFAHSGQALLGVTGMEGNNVGRVVLVLGFAALFAGCAGRGQLGQPFLPNAATNNGALLETAGTGSLVIRVSIGVQPDYISPSTKAMTVKISGPTSVQTIAGLTLNANGCKSRLMTLQCALKIRGLTNCPSNKNCYTATVSTYDAYNARKNKIPPSANVLSRNEAFGFSIQGGNRVIPLILYGVPRSVVFLPATGSSLTGTQAAGFIEPKCSARPQTVTAVGADIQGNYIFGVGAPAVSMTSSTPSQLSVSKSGANTFVLTPPRAPKYAYGNFTTHLRVTAAPNAKAGGKPTSGTVNVSYSGDICGIFTEFTSRTAASVPTGITAGPDGNMWFTENAVGKIARITLGGAITEFPIPAPSASPVGIVTGPDHNLWFAENNNSRIGKITTSGKIVDYPTPTQSAIPVLITVGADRNLWFTECGAGNVAKITTRGAITEYPTPTQSSAPQGITEGPDGNVWFTESNVGQIGQITTAGTIREASSPSGSTIGPLGITTGADGALWFAEANANQIGRITTLGTVFPEYPLPEVSSFPVIPTLGPDGAVWFTELGGGRIGRITTAGAITEYAIPTPMSQPALIALGPDGALWFAEMAGNKIGRLR